MCYIFLTNLLLGLPTVQSQARDPVESVKKLKTEKKVAASSVVAKAISSVIVRGPSKVRVAVAASVMTHADLDATTKDVALLAATTVVDLTVAVTEAIHLTAGQIAVTEEEEAVGALVDTEETEAATQVQEGL